MNRIDTISPFSKILVGIDQSESSNLTFEYALRLSKLSGAKIYLVYVIQIPQAAGSFVGISDLEKYLEEEAQKLLDSIVMRVAKKFNFGKNVNNIERIIKKGHPSKVILDLSKSIGVDLIVVGSRGIGGVKEFLLGSISHTVARHASVPVLIVK
jgi:nucleotide-binding universal stress UspA family protein